MKKLLTLCSILALTLTCGAQTSTISGQIQDPSAQTFNNGTCTISFVPNPLQPNTSIYNVSGSTFNLQPACSFDGSGNISATVTRNDFITPSGSKWMFIVSPNADTQSTTAIISVTAASLNVASTINALVQNITVFSGRSIPRAYNDSEIVLTPNAGQAYWDTTLGLLKFWNGSSFSATTTNGGNNSFSGQNSLTAYKINNTIYVDGNKYPCTAAGINAALAALPTGGGTPGGTVDATGCPNGGAISLTTTIGPVGTATVPMTLLLGSGNYSCAMTSGNCFNVGGGGSSIIGKGPLDTFVTAAVGFTGDLIHVEPISPALAMNWVEIAKMRLELVNTPTLRALNILSVRDPSSIHDLFIFGYTGNEINVTTSTISGALIPQGIKFYNVYTQSAANTTLTDNTVFITGNEIQYGSNDKVITDPSTGMGGFSGIVITPTATTQGDGRNVHVYGTAVGCSNTGGIGLLITSPAGASTGARGDVVDSGNTFELCTTGIKVTGANGTHKATNITLGPGNTYVPSTTNLAIFDFTASSYMYDITNGNAGDVSFTANATSNLFFGIVTNLTDVSNLNSSNAIISCRNVSNSAVCTFGTNGGAGSTYTTVDTIQKSGSVNTGTSDDILGNLRITLLKTAAGATYPLNSLAATATNDNATTGSLGEYVTATVATGSSVSLSTGTTANVTSVSLTAGDWDCRGSVDYTFGATTSYTNLVGGISTTSATLGGQDTKFDFETPAAVPTATADATWTVPTVRESLASTTTVFLVAQATFTVSTLKAYGTISCRRVR